jgi:hypothetical protein
MASFDFGAFFLTLAKAFNDAKTNALYTPPASSVKTDLITGLRNVQNKLPAFIAFLAAHPGDEAAIDDVLAFFETQGYVWATAARQILASTPDALNKIEQWLPSVLWGMAEFSPAATGIQGDHQDGAFRTGRG